MLHNVSLNASMRANLLSLQQTSKLQDMTSNRLSTGLKVNSAIDNPSAYYTAQSLSDRASDLNSLLDAMSQGIQTLKAVSKTLETASAFLGQAAAVLTQSYTQTETAAVHKSIEEYEKQGYTVISSDMDSASIQALLTDGAKLVLSGDIVLDDKLSIDAANVTIDGNGYKISYAGSDNMLTVRGSDTTITNINFNYSAADGGSAILIDGADASADISHLTLKADGKRAYGVRVTNGGGLKLDNAQGISVSGFGSQKLVNGNAELYDGQSNTQAIVGEIGTDSLAASAANQFYAPGTDKHGTFGQGSWYLPSIGELMDMYGTDASGMTGGYGTSGAVGDNKNKINTALTILAGKDSKIASALSNGYYWSSSEFNSNHSLYLSASNGYRDYRGKYNFHYSVRCFQLLENCFPPFNSSAGASSAGDAVSGEAAPQIGDIMYSDLTYGSADDYDGSKTAVGVVTWVSEDGTSAKIMNLKDLRFSSTDQAGNFNPDDPYNGSVGYTRWTTDSTAKTEDIDDVTNFTSAQLLAEAKTKGTITVSNTNLPNGSTGGNAGSGIDSEAVKEQYQEILAQYDALISDGNYKGVNLLRGDSLKVSFNEDRSSYLDITGVNASSQALGLGQREISTLEDISRTLEDISSALNQLRGYAEIFGSHNSVLTTRQNFTEAMINVLEEGADKLTLADMNQESANMLALQTRQMLAVNTLSLASQASRAVLYIF